MKSESKAIDICLEFSDEIFHNPQITNIIVRIKRKLVVDLNQKLNTLDFRIKTVVPEDKEYSLVNFEKIYSIYD